MFVFNLKYKWYSEIASGRKTVEYREVKPYWETRLKKIRPNDKVAFRCGYGHLYPDVIATVTAIDIGKCPYEGWDGDYYRIHFEK